MNNNRSVRSRAFVGLAGLCLFVLCAALGAQAQSAPKYKFDPDWPKPLPHNWKMGGVTGLAVDKDDNVWVLDRPHDLRDMELRAELPNPTSDCCTLPPSMIHIDKNGDVIGSFDAPGRARHGRRQQGICLYWTGHGPQIRSQDRANRSVKCLACRIGWP